MSLYNLSSKCAGLPTAVLVTSLLFSDSMCIWGQKYLTVLSITDLCRSWNGQRQQRIEDKAILLGIDSINGLDHPLIQFFLKSSFL